MKTILFCTSYINTSKSWKTRYKRWLNYYQSSHLHSDIILMIDDGATYTPADHDLTIALEDSSLPKDCCGTLLYRFKNRLGRTSLIDYPGWWRSFLKSVELADYLGADKIIHIESDAFLLSGRIVDLLNNITTGWHVMWSQHYQFPETAIQVICRDQFQAMKDFKRRHESEIISDIAENILPFTDIHREFIGDRYSEFGRSRRGIFRSRKFDRFKIFWNNRIFKYMPLDADFATQVEAQQEVSQRFRDPALKQISDR